MILSPIHPYAIIPQHLQTGVVVNKIRAWMPTIVSVLFSIAVGHGFAVYVWSHEREAAFGDFYGQASIRDWFAMHIMSLIIIICSLALSRAIKMRNEEQE